MSNSSEPDISVIIPAYNIAPYIEECAASLQGQTCRDFEAILVDDGSTDDTGAICDRIAAADGRFRVIHTTGYGLSGARNAALDTVRGRYIYFLDGDDALFPQTLEIMLYAARETGADIVCTPFAPGTTLPERHAIQNGTPRILEPVEAVRLILYQQDGNNSACAKLYDASLWKSMRFTRGILYEDLDLFYRLMLRSRRVVFLDTPLYFYRTRPGSILDSFTPRRADVLDVTDRMVEWVRANEPTLTDAARTRRLSAHINILGLMRASGTEIPGVAERCLAVVRSDGPYCRRLPQAKKSLRLAMTLLMLTGDTLFTKLLAFAYRRNIRHR